MSDFLKKVDGIFKQTLLPKLIVISDKKIQGSLLEILNKVSIPAFVILRDYELEDRAEYFSNILSKNTNQNLKFLVANDYALYLNLSSSFKNVVGVHIPQYNYILGQEIRKQESGIIISAACHSFNALKQVKTFANFCLFSPFFLSINYPEKKPINLKQFAKKTKNETFPIYALGGVNTNNIDALKDLNLSGVAAIRAFSI